MTFGGACLVLSVGAGILNYRDATRDAAAARADTRLLRPLVSTSGRILFHVQTMATYDTEDVGDTEFLIEEQVDRFGPRRSGAG